MRTNIDIDDDLMREAMRASGAATKRGARDFFRTPAWSRRLRWAEAQTAKLSAWSVPLRSGASGVDFFAACPLRYLL